MSAVLIGESKMKKVIIGIPAYNEEKNIGNLLNDLLEQKIEKDIITDIYIVSDMSTDKTDEIVNSFVEKCDNIKLIRKDKRTGKSSSMELLFEIAKDYDNLIVFDADVRLNVDTVKNLLEKITVDGADLVAGSAIPTNGNIFNVAIQANFFGWAFINKVKNNQDHSICHLCGCVFAMSKKLYTGMKLSIGIADDTFIYLSCFQRQMKFVFAPNAIVYVNPPRVVKDYLKQSVRRTAGEKENEKIFGKSLVKKSKMNDIYSILFKTFIRYPYQGLCWLILYSYGQIFMVSKTKTDATWEISNTTK